MKFQLALATVLSLTAVMAPHQAHAGTTGTTVLLPAYAVSVDEETTAALQHLFRSSLLQQQAVVRMGDAALTQEADAAALGKACNEAACQRLVRLELVGVRRNVTVNASIYSASGQLVDSHSVRSRGLRDIESVLDRLARMVVSGASLEDTVTRNNVIDAETKTGRRIRAEKLPGIQFGVLVPTVKNPTPALKFAFDMRWEYTNYFLELTAGGVIPTKMNSCDDYYDRDCDSGETPFGYAFLDLAAAYVANLPGAAPYIGGGLGPRLGGAGTFGAGVGGFAMVGLMFNRTSNLRPYAQVKAGVDWLAGAENELPVHVGLEVGIGF